MVEESGTHADEGIIVYAGSMEGDIVSDRNIISYFDSRFFIKSM